MSTIRVVPCRFGIGSITSTQATLQGDLVGVLVSFPVAATLELQMQIDQNTIGYSVNSLRATITGNTDFQCILLPDVACLSGAQIRFRSSVAATELVDCFALIRND